MVCVRSPEFFLPAEGNQKINDYLRNLREKSSFIVVNPAANWKPKRWPAKSFAALSDRLIGELNCAVVFVGAEKDIDIFLSNDSGPAHLAAGLGVNTLIIFGSTSPQVTAPRGEKVRIIRSQVDPPAGRAVCKIPCYNLNCKDNICMKKVTVEQVFREIKAVLENDQKYTNKFSY